jgi:transposase-like protein
MKEKGSAQFTCPGCGFDTFYRYGRSATGNQRYLCLACGRQFTADGGRPVHSARPSCPRCGKEMYLYKREEGLIRYRCSRYPECRTYQKMETTPCPTITPSPEECG